MNRPTSELSELTRSPWLDPTNRNLYRYEFYLAKENYHGGYHTPLEPYRWIHKNKGEQLFFKGLARFAPMFPVIAYNGQIAAWTSPPTSGFGNAIYIVIGHDITGKLRLAGGNCFTAPSRRSGSPLDSKSFFQQFDQADKRQQIELIANTVKKSIQQEDDQLLLNIQRECEHFQTMAIYITALTENGSLFHAGKAVAEGVRPADLSYEFIGEIK